MEKTSDDVLWRRAAREDHDAFAELFDRHARRIYGFCFRQTADWALAQDLTSVTFLEAWRKRRSALIEEGKVAAWLLGIAYNSVRTQRRSIRRYRRALDRLPAPHPEPDHADESTARAAAEHQAAELLQQMRQLPKAQRAALALIAWEGLSAAEAAVALDQPEATVRSHLLRARQHLRSKAKEDATEPPTPPSVSLDERIGV